MVEDLRKRPYRGDPDLKGYVRLIRRQVKRFPPRTGETKVFERRTERLIRIEVSEETTKVTIKPNLDY